MVAEERLQACRAAASAAWTIDQLAAKLDPEEWRTLVNAYLDEASAAVTELGGHVLKKLGDGLMALFGYPHAQENDAERAVRAALAIQRALADLNARNARSGAPELSARIGIECGSVVVDASGEVFGEAPNVAARVQAAAEPGSVLVTGSVQRQVAGLFVVEEKGAHELKGVAQPLSLYRVVRASGGGRRGGVRALTSVRRTRGGHWDAAPSLGPRPRRRGPSRHHRSGVLWCHRSGVELPRLMARMTRAIASVPGPLSSSTAINLARSVSIWEASKATR